MAFELTIPPRLPWADLVRDLVASRAASLDLGLDRFQDLLVLATQVTSDMIERPGVGNLEVKVTVNDSRLEMVIASNDGDSSPAPVSDLALEGLADEHWYESTETGSSVGFAMVAGPARRVSI